LPSTKPWSRLPLDNTDTYEPGVGASESPRTSPTPSANRKTHPASQPTAAPKDTARKLEPYLASIDNTLKGLEPYLAQVNEFAPYLAQVNRILERLKRRKRLERRLASEVPPLTPLRTVPTPIAMAKQGTILRYLVRKSENSTDGESGAQPTPLEETSSATGFAIPPSKIATPRGQSPETVDWGDALHGCQVNWGAARETEEPLIRPMENEQPSGSSATANTTDEADTHRESGAHPTPPGETPDANEPDPQPRDGSLPQEAYPERFDW